MEAPFTDLKSAAARVPDGALVALGRPSPMALVRELIRQGRRGLRLVGVPTGALGVELLIANGCAASLESSGVDLGEFGFAPAFSRAVESGSLRMIDSTCPAMLMALQAGASGVSFTPVPGLLGTDLMRRRPDFREVEDPFRPGRRIALVPAIAPEFALVHARRADPRGNAVIGTDFDDRLIIRASGTVVMSVEEVFEGATSTLAPGEQLIPAAYLDVLTHTPAEIRPIDDASSISEYLESARAISA